MSVVNNPTTERGHESNEPKILQFSEASEDLEEPFFHEFNEEVESPGGLEETSPTSGSSTQNHPGDKDDTTIDNNLPSSFNSENNSDAQVLLNSERKNKSPPVSPSISPVYSPQTHADLESDLQPDIRQISDSTPTGSSSSPEVQRKADEMFNAFLMHPKTVKQVNELILTTLYRYLLETGDYDKHREASSELIRSVKEEKNILNINGKIGNLLISKFFNANFVPMEGIQNADQKTIELNRQEKLTGNNGSASNRKVINPSSSQQEILPEISEIDLAREIQLQSPFVPIPHNGPSQNQQGNADANSPSCSVNRMVMDNILDDETTADQPSSPISNVQNMPEIDILKRSVLEKYLGGGILQKAYTEMGRCDNPASNCDIIQNRVLKIKIGGRVLFPKIFTAKEIVEGNVSGTKTARNTDKRKYDEKKVSLLSQVIAWLLEKPVRRTVDEFFKYQEQTQSIGLQGYEFNVAFKQTVLVDFANSLRAKMKKNEAVDVSPNVD